MMRVKKTTAASISEPCDRDRPESSESNQDIINKIVILTNGSGEFTNTCAIDSVAQILAAACAFDPIYKERCVKWSLQFYYLWGEYGVQSAPPQQMYEQNPVTKSAKESTPFASTVEIQKLRTKILSLFPKSNMACVVPEVLFRTLKHTPSLTETQCNLTVKVSRTFGEHLFIEMPAGSLEKGSEYEKIVTVDQLNLEISIDVTKYCLCGLILFRPPLLRGGIGHYAAVVIIMNDYIIFDDLLKRPYKMNKNENFIIQCLFYKKQMNKMTFPTQFAK
ncbi:hypothetical protein Bhyg_03176, partial [Pseudolycoriella hygida]